MIRALLSMAALALLGVSAPLTRLVPVDEAAYPKTIAALKGKTVLVNFWATWCEPCRAEMPALAKMAAELGPKGLALVTVSADEPEDEKAAVAFLQKSGIAAPAYLKRAQNDDRFINSIEPKWSGALPALILYDKTGKKVKSWTGETDLKLVRAAVEKLN
jgi:thiol-disulfide isomerase/thioredoxin